MEEFGASWMKFNLPKVLTSTIGRSSTPEAGAPHLRPELHTTGRSSYLRTEPPNLATFSRILEGQAIEKMQCLNTKSLFESTYLKFSYNYIKKFQNFFWR